MVLMILNILNVLKKTDLVNNVKVNNNKNIYYEYKYDNSKYHNSNESVIKNQIRGSVGGAVDVDEFPT